MNKKTLMFLPLMVFTIFYTNLTALNRLDLLDSYGYGRESSVDRANALNQTCREKSKAESELASISTSLELATKSGSEAAIKEFSDLKQNQETLIKTLKRQITNLEPTTISDIIFRMSLGEDPKSVLREFNIHDVGAAKLFGYYTLASGAKVLGKRFDTALDQSIGEPFGGFLYNGFSKIGKAMRFVCDKVTGREGEPFEAKEVSAWQARLDLTLQALENQARTALRMGGRDKVSRMMGEDLDGEAQDPTDPQWEVQKILFAKTFINIVNQIDSKIKYYSPKKDAQLIEYATQIKEWILAFLDHCWNKTKTNKDLGSTNNLTFLSNLRGQLNNAFSMLNSYLTYSDDSKNKTKPMATNPYAGFSRPRNAFLNDSEDDDTF